MAQRTSQLLFVCLLSLAVVGCTNPRVDGSSEAAFNASIAKIGESLDTDEKQKFGESMTAIAGAEMLRSMGEAFAGRGSAVDGPTRVRNRLNGMTADEVIDEAATLRDSLNAQQREAALAQARTLQERQAAARVARIELRRFVVSGARFSRTYSYGFPELTIAMTVTNGTSSPISRAYFHARVVSPGRAIPWIEQDFNYEILGGLEAGETDTWRLNPNRFSEWGVETPRDAQIEIVPVRLDGPDGQPLYDASFSAADSLQLLELLRPKS